MRVKKQFGGKRKGYKGEWWDSGLAKFFTPLGRRSIGSRIGNFASWWGLPIAKYIANIPMKKGGRVCGVGKATHGYGRAMRKK